MSSQRLLEIGSSSRNGTNACIRQYIRGPTLSILKHVHGGNRVLAFIKEDFKHAGTEANNTADQIVARAIKAIIGAVYLDGGYRKAREVQARLGIAIKNGT